MDLRYDMIGAFYMEVGGHPEVVMKELSISYKKGIPQSLGDQWWFVDCVFNVQLPEYITEMVVEDYWKGGE